MAALTAARPVARYGDPNQVFPSTYGPLGIVANTLLFGGAMVGTDASGNMLSADAATCIQVIGVARTTYYNRTTDPSGGAAGAVKGEALAGPFPFTISADGGAITNANRWQTLYVVDNQSVSLAANTALGVARLAAGYLIAVDTLGGPTNGMAWVQLGELNPYAGVTHMQINLTLAQIQAQTSGVAFTVITFPANAYLLGASVTNTQTFAGGGVSSMAVTMSGGADAAGTILASGSVLTLGNVNVAPGSSPYQKRGGQAIKIVLTEGTGTLATLTAGTLAIDLFVGVFS